MLQLLASWFPTGFMRCLSVYWHRLHIFVYNSNNNFIKIDIKASTNRFRPTFTEMLVETVNRLRFYYNNL